MTPSAPRLVDLIKKYANLRDHANGTAVTRILDGEIDQARFSAYDSKMYTAVLADLEALREARVQAAIPGKEALGLVQSMRLTGTPADQSVEDTIKQLSAEVQKHAPWNGKSTCDCASEVQVGDLSEVQVGDLVELPHDSPLWASLMTRAASGGAGVPLSMSEVVAELEADPALKVGDRVGLYDTGGGFKYAGEVARLMDNGQVVCRHDNPRDGYFYANPENLKVIPWMKVIP